MKPKLGAVIMMLLSSIAFASDAVVALPDGNRAFVVLGEGKMGWHGSGKYKHVCHMGF